VLDEDGEAINDRNILDYIEIGQGGKGSTERMFLLLQEGGHNREWILMT
jgi:hypothetical protein